MFVTYWAMLPRCATTHTRPSVVGSVVSTKAKGTITWPDSAARMKRLGPRAATGTPASRIIREMREERF